MDAPLRSIVPAAPSVRVVPRPRSRNRRGDDKRFADELLRTAEPAAEKAAPESKNETPVPGDGEPGSTIDVIG